MRIGLNQTPSPDQVATKRSDKPAVANTQVGAHDATSVSKDMVSLSSLAQHALSTPPVREAKVQQLQQAIASGKYKLEADKMAEAMIADRVDPVK